MTLPNTLPLEHIPLLQTQIMILSRNMFFRLKNLISSLKGCTRKTKNYSDMSTNLQTQVLKWHAVIFFDLVKHFKLKVCHTQHTTPNIDFVCFNIFHIVLRHRSQVIKGNRTIVAHWPKVCYLIFDVIYKLAFNRLVKKKIKFNKNLPLLIMLTPQLPLSNFTPSYLCPKGNKV